MWVLMALVLIVAAIIGIFKVCALLSTFLYYIGKALAPVVPIAFLLFACVVDNLFIIPALCFGVAYYFVYFKIKARTKNKSDED